MSTIAPSKLTRLSAALVATTLLCACTSPTLIKSVDEAAGNAPKNLAIGSLPTTGPMAGGAQAIESKAQSQRDPKVLQRTSAPYIGGAFVPTTFTDSLPKIFDIPYEFNFGSGRVSIATVASRLTKLTGVPVRVRADVTPAPVPGSSPLGGARGQGSGSAVSGLPNNFASLPSMPSTPGSPVSGMNNTLAGLGDPGGTLTAIAAPDITTVDAVSMRWSGKLRDFLDHLTNTLSLSWEYRDGAVVIMRLVSQSYTIAAVHGQQKYSMSAGGTNTGSTGQQGSSTSLQSSSQLSESGTSDALKAVAESVSKLIAATPGSSAVLNEQTGTLVVTTSKEIQSQVRDYIDAENKILRQTINVTFDIYSLKTSEQQQQGFDLTLLRPFSIDGQKGNLSVTSPATLADSTAGVIKVGGTVSSAVLTALKANGQSVQHRPVTVSTQNGKWDTKTRLSSISYLKETTPGSASSSGAAGAPGLKTDTLTIGDQYSVLPIVQPDRSVLLKYNIILSDLIGLFEVSVGSGDTLQKVQTPKTDSVSASSTLLLAPGETAVITGLSRISSSDDTARLGEQVPIIFGGSNKAKYEREHFLILVRATLQ